jgi:hypothetical protein
MKEEQHLNHYKWIDQENDIAQIPIERAIELYIEQKKNQ